MVSNWQAVLILCRYSSAIPIDSYTAEIAMMSTPPAYRTYREEKTVDYSSLSLYFLHSTRFYTELSRSESL